MGAHYGIRTQDYKLIYYYGEPAGVENALDEIKEPEWEFFDLRKDPLELKNVYTDPAYQDVVSELKIELAQLKDEAEDDR